jgi:GcrA cell cycle regulator
MTWVAWTQMANARLRELVALGKTMAEAARDLCVTRNAVAGRAQRMHLKWNNAPHGKGVKRECVRKVNPVKDWKPPVPAWTGAPIELLALTPYSCRWPIGEGNRWSPQKFCGAPCDGVDHAHPYCALHEKQAWRRIKL